MNILFVAWNFPPKKGGAENFIYNIYKNLRSKYEIYLIGPNKNLAFFMILSSIKMIKVLLTKKVDVVFSGNALPLPQLVILGKLFRKKIVITIHGLDITYKNPVYQFLIKSFLPKVDRIVANSSLSKKRAIERGVDSDKITVINPGTNIKDYQIKESQLDLKRKYKLGDKKIILSVGRLAKRKGVLEFISKSLPLIVKEFPEVVYVVIGGNPKKSLTHKEDLLSIIKEEVLNKNLQNNIKLLGEVDQKTLIEYYNLSDILILPVIPMKEDMEGFGIVFIEAGACGKPVIGTNTGGIPDAVDKGKSGILIEPTDNLHKNFAESIVHLFKNPELMEKMGNYGKKRVKEKFDWSIIAKKYKEIFKNAIIENSMNPGIKRRKNMKLLE